MSSKELVMYINGISREQLYLFENKLDDMISGDNPVRFIDAYVDNLDLLKLGFTNPGTNGWKGRPPYNPSMMLKIYMYGYLNRIRSSRKLEAECGRNTELIWLTCRLAPDFKTIADFRKDNKTGIKRIFREFLKLCGKLDLLSFRCVAVDGTKERAQNHLDNIYQKESMERISARIQEQIEIYLEELELNDRAEEAEYEFLSKNLKEKLSKLKKKEDKIDIIKQMFAENPELKTYFAGDCDSRYMKDNNRINAGYNCQTAVDEKNNLIIAQDVTNESNDMHQINSMMNKVNEVKEELGIENQTIVVADAGYFEEREIVEAVKDERFDIYISHPRDSQAQKKKVQEDEGKIPAKGFRKDDFIYDKEKDVFVCPAGKVLLKEGNGYIDKRTGTRKFKYTCRECNECKHRSLCTNDKSGRSIKVTEFFCEINEFREKCNSALGKKLLSKRKEIVEHPFGTIKHSWGYRYFMQKGKDKVSAEFSFIAFIYNLKRVLNIVDFDKLMEAI
jgi:transposase